MINSFIMQVMPYASLFIEMLLMIYAIFRFTEPFVIERRGAVCAGAAYFSAVLLFGLIPVMVGEFVMYCLGVAAAFVVMCAFDRRNCLQKVFLALLFLSVLQLSSALADILQDYVYSMLADLPLFSGNQHEMLWAGLYISMCIFYLLVKFSILMSSTWLIAREYVCKNDGLMARELCMLSMFPLVGICGYFVMRHYRTFYILKEETVSAKMDAVSVFFYVVLLAGICVSVVLYQGIKVEQEEKLLAGQVEDMKRHIVHVEEAYAGIRSLKHDMADHIVTLERLYADRNTKEADAYAARLKESLKEAAGVIQSGNPVTDAVLSEHKDEAEKKGICFQCDFHYPAGSCIEAFDLSVILSNALRNAVEHADAGEGEQAYISLCSYRKNNACMIEVRNSFTGRVRIEKDTGLIPTSKGHGLHGYGLANIRRTAGRYYGDIAVSQGGGEFCLTIMLMME